MMRKMEKRIVALILMVVLLLIAAGAHAFEMIPIGHFEYKENADGVTITKYIGRGNQEVVVPSFINGKPVLSVGNNAFTGNGEIVTVILGQYVRRIGNNTFSGCGRLETVIVPGYLTSYGKYAFEKCRSMKVIIGIPGSEAENMARANNLDFYSIDTRMEGYGQITSSYETPAECFKYKINSDGITITKYTGKKRKDVVIPAMIGGIPVLSVGNDAFTHNSEIENVVIGEYVIRIGNNAFASCANLRYVLVMGNVESWGKYAFDKCRKLKAIVGFEGTTTQQIADEFGVPYGFFEVYEE